MALKQSIIGSLLITLGILLIIFSIRLYVTRLNTTQQYIEITVKDQIKAEWRQAKYPRPSGAGLLGLGEYYTTQDLTLEAPNQTTFILKKGNPLLVGSATLKLIPFMATFAFITMFAGTLLVVNSIRPVRLPPGLDIKLFYAILILLIITPIFSRLYPKTIDIHPGDTAYLHIEDRTAENGNIIVWKGKLISQERTKIDNIFNLIITLIITGIGLILTGTGLHILKQSLIRDTSAK